MSVQIGRIEQYCALIEAYCCLIIFLLQPLAPLASMSINDQSTSRQDVHYRFGPFRLEPAERRLLRGEEQIDLPPKAFDTLVVLVENSGRLVSKDYLLDTVWPDVVVEENYVSVNISRLRAALGETAQDWNYIETVPRSGYRFASVVEVVNELTGDHRTQRGSDHDRVAYDPEDIQDSQPRRLNRASLAGALLLAVAAAVLLWWNQTASGDSVQSVAVLPLQSIGSIQPEGLGISLTDALITSIGGASTLEVRPTSAVIAYDDSLRDPIAVGRRLGVDVVLDGRVQHADGLLRISLQLVQTSNGMTRWSGAFSAPASNLIMVQDSLALKVVRALELELGVREINPIATAGTEVEEAHEAYLRGRYLFSRRTRSDLRESLALFRQAIHADPSFALAHASMAEVYSLLTLYDGVDPHEAFPRARAAAGWALDFDPSLAEAYVPLATTTWVYGRDPAEAESLFRRALDLKPNLVTAHHGLGQLLAMSGNLDDGLRHLNRARELDPLSSVIAVDAGSAYLFNGKLDEALSRYEAVADIDRDFALVHVFTGIAHEAAGRAKEAIAAYERAIETGGRSPIWLANLGHAYGSVGRIEDARAILNELEQIAEDRYVSPFGLLLIHEGLGDREKALEQLGVAIASGDPLTIYLSSDPRLEDLRADARYEEVLANPPGG